MGILDYFKKMREGHRSKHQVHVSKKKRMQKRAGRVAVATIHPAGSKLAKYFQKAGKRSPRGY